MDARTLQFIIALLIILPLVYFRMRRSMKPQRLKPARLLIRPGIIIVAAIVLMGTSPPPSSAYVWFGLSAIVGGSIGWYWGKLTKLHLHPEDGTVISTNSQAGVMVLIALILFRFGVRAGFGAEGSAMHLDVGTTTDILIIFSALLFSARGLEIYLRARQLLQTPG